MRIFCTVGSRLPFDRLTRTVDEFALEHDSVSVFFQIGVDAGHIPNSHPYRQMLDQEQFDVRVGECDLIVAHAGMGTIITALTLGLPVLVMPRRECFRETRNDHQVYTAKKLSRMGLVHVAKDECELKSELQNAAMLGAAPLIGPSASDSLIQSVQSFIDQNGATH